jgi:hypothetical protein
MEEHKPKKHYPAAIHFATKHSESKIAEGRAARRPGGRRRTKFDTDCSCSHAPLDPIHGKDGIVESEN